jgi:hypothetical protein
MATNTARVPIARKTAELHSAVANIDGNQDRRNGGLINLRNNFGHLVLLGIIGG